MLTIELPAHADQTAFNERRWSELVSDPVLAKFEGVIETDRHGQILMSPPPSGRHVRYQNRITHLLQMLMPAGEALTSCPVSTADGVRVPDSSWLSKGTVDELGNRLTWPKAPEICVEVLSPDNSQREIMEKAALYFDAGAREVWICDRHGKMRFLEGVHQPAMAESKFCPLFPTEIKLD